LLKIIDDGQAYSQSMPLFGVSSSCGGVNTLNRCTEKHAGKWGAITLLEVSCVAESLFAPQALGENVFCPATPLHGRTPYRIRQGMHWALVGLANARPLSITIIEILNDCREQTG